MRVLVVDDDPLGSRMVQFLLAEQGYTVEMAGTAHAALQHIERTPPDLLLLDVNLPQLNGFDLYKRLRSRGIDIPVIFVTAKDEVENKVLGLEMGADDYIAKPFQPAELTARVSAVLRRYRKSGRGSEPITASGLVIDPIGLTVTAPGHRPVSLTPTEMKVLVYLAQRAGQPVSRDELMASVWGETFEGESNIVDVYIRRLRRKLEDDPAHPRLIQAERGVGYTLTR